MNRALRTVAVAAVALLSLSGCMKMQMDFTLQEDDTVDGSIVMAVQKGLGEDLGMSDEDVLSQLEQESDFSDIEGATVEPYDDGDYVGQKVSFDAQPLGELEQQGTGLTIAREGDEFVVGGDLDTGGEDLSLLGDSEVTVSITFPGDVTEHNGTLEGTTVTWDLLTQTEPLNARGAATTGAAIPWLWIGLGLGVLLLAAGAVTTVVLLRGRKVTPTTGEVPQAYSTGEGYAPQAYAPQTPVQEMPAQGFTPQAEAPQADAPQAPEPVNPFAPPAPPVEPRPQQPQNPPTP